MNNNEPKNHNFGETNLTLKKKGIERDPDGKLILYHATTAEKLIKILQSGKLLPPNITKESTWSLGDENEHEEKGAKIYIGSRDFVENKGPAQGVTFKDGGRSYILKVHVSEDTLRPDEDTQA